MGELKDFNVTSSLEKDSQGALAVELASYVVKNAIESDWNLDLFNDPFGVKRSAFLVRNDINEEVFEEIELDIDVEEELGNRKAALRDVYEWAVVILTKALDAEFLKGIDIETKELLKLQIIESLKSRKQLAGGTRSFDLLYTVVNQLAN